MEELSGVLGLTQAYADRLRPFVTIHSGLAAIDTNVAPKALVDILARGLREGGSEPARLPVAAAVPRRFDPRPFSIRSQSRTAPGAIFVREAIVEFVAPTWPAFALRRWYRGSAASPGPAAAVEGLPRC